MNYKLLMDTALLAGEIMLTSGAETYRVEDTMCRILKISNLERTEAFVMMTGIVATLDDPSIDAITLVKRIDKQSTNLNFIYLANDISRKLCCMDIDLESAYQGLKEISEKKQYSELVLWLAMIFATVTFVILLGGNTMDCMVAMLNGLLLVLCKFVTRRIIISRFITNLVASILVAINTMIFVNMTGLNVNNEIIISGSIMPMVPGVAITNAIRDTLQGDYMSGTTRAIEAFVIAASIAVGIGVGLGIYVIGGNLF